MKLPDTNQRRDVPARKAVAYVRRSTDRQDQSIGDQRRAIESYAQKNGFEIVGWYEDDAISGATVDGRRQFKLMLADAQAQGRAWRYLLVYDVSRFSRGAINETAHYRHLFEETGVEIIYCKDNLPAGAVGDLMVNVHQFMAHQYVLDLSKVTLRGQSSHAATGAFSGGTAAYGYDVMYFDSAGCAQQRVRRLESGDTEIYTSQGELVRLLPRGERFNASTCDTARLVPSIPERVAIIQRIFRESVELGRGCRAIASELNRDGIPSPRNGNWSSNTRSQWSLSTIRAILRNPCYKGDTAWNRRTFAKFHRLQGGVAVERPRVDSDKPRENPEHDWVVVPNTHEALVPPAMFDRAQQLLKDRGQNKGEPNYRRGSGTRSPFLLSSLITCGRCGAHYQGRTANSTKRRLDGSKIQTRYYLCGAHVMKGPSACAKFALRQGPLEELLMETVQARLQTLLHGAGETILRQMIEEEIAAQGLDPQRELKQVRARVAEIDAKANVLLEGLSPDTKGFVDAKLRDLGTERRGLQSRLEALEAAPYAPLDADAILREGLTSIADLPRLLESANIEERKLVMNAFIAGITVRPDEARLDLLVRPIPMIGATDSTVRLVAGARFEPVQIEMRPMQRFVVGLRKAA